MRSNSQGEFTWSSAEGSDDAADSFLLVCTGNDIHPWRVDPASLMAFATSLTEAVQAR